MKNKFSKWDVGGGSRSIVQGLNLFTSRNLFKSLKSILMVVALLSLSSNVWGADYTGSLEITISNFTEITASYTTKFTHEYTINKSATETQKCTIEAYGVYKNSNGIQMNSGKGTYIKNTSAFPGYITSIECTWTATGKNSPTLYVNNGSVASTSSTSLGKGSNTTTTQTYTVTNASTSKCNYFYFDGTTVTGACYLSKLKINYTVAAATPVTSLDLYVAGQHSDLKSGKKVGDKYTLPTPAEVTAECGDKVLVGWSTVEIQTPGAKPSSNFYEPGDEVTLTANNTFYAVFADASSGGEASYKVTTTLTKGETYIFGAVKAAASPTLANNTTFGAVAFTNTYNSSSPNWGQRVDLTPDANGKIAATNTSITNECKWVLESIDDGNYKFKKGTNYLYLGTSVGSTSGAQSGISTTGNCYIENVNSTCKDAFLLHPASSSTNIMLYNTSNGYRMYASRSYSATMAPYVRFYEYNPGVTYSNYTTSCGPSTYTVNFECNGATSGCPSQMTEQTNLPNPLPTTQQKTGYTFGGWYTNEGLTNAATAGAALTENTTLYAKWNIINRTVTYNGDGQLNYIAKPTIATIEDAGIEVTYSVNTGYEITGVFVTMGGTALVENTDFTWDQDDVTIVPDDGNGITGNIVVTFTVQATSPETKIIYLRPNANWLSNSGGQKFSVYNMSSGQFIDFMTESACAPGVYSLEILASITQVIFVRHNITATTPSWADGNKWNQTGDLTIPGSNNLFTIPDGAWDGSTTTWSTYAEPQYTVTCHPNGGDGGDIVVSNKKCGDKVNLASAPTRTGWTFLGWYDGSGNHHNAGEEVTVSGNMQYWAHWEAYVLHGNFTGSWTDNHFYVNNDYADIALAANTTYEFGIAYRKTDVTEVWKGQTGSSSMTRGKSTWTLNGSNNVKITADVAGTYRFAYNTSTASMTVTYPEKVTVTYDGNGNTSGSAPAAVDYAKGATVTVAGNTGSLAKTGYDFGGWNTKNDGTGTNYTAGSGTFTISANTTLYAEWTIKSYAVTKGTVTGGSATVPSSVNHGGDVTLTNLTPDANHKLPYTITVTGNYGSIDDATIKNVTSAITVNVSFAEKAQYTVTFKNNGTQTSTESVVEGGKVSSLPALAASQAPISGYTFMGWVNHSDVWIGFEAEMTQALITGNEVINADVTYDAVWAKAYDDYGRVIEGENLTTGKYLFTSNGDYALDNNFTTGTTAGKSITDEDGWVYEITDPTIIWVITAKDNTYSFYNAAKGKYLNTVSDNANLTLQDSPAWFTLTRTKDSYNNSLFDFACNGRHLEYYSSKFDTDASRMYGTIMLYKQDVSNYFVTPPAQITVTWHIGNGTQTATTYDGTAFSDVDAPEVDDDAIGDCVNKFMGWATAAITKDVATAEDVNWADETTISNSNKDFYAVFAQAEGSGDYTLVSGASQLGEGEAYIGSYINYSGWSYYVATGAGDITQTTLSENVLTPTEAMLKLTLVSTGTANQYYLKDANGKYLHASGTGVNPTLSETACAWTFSGESSLMGMKSSLGSNVYLCAYSSGTTGKLKTYSTESGNAKICVYLSSVTYSNYATSCPDLKYATIHFDANGKTLASGSMPADITNAIVDKANTLPGCSATVTGYTFTGWSETSTGSVITEYTPATEGETYTMYAKWTPKTVTITWNANGGSVDQATSQYTYDGASVELPTPTTTLEKKFVGWFTAATGGTQITEIGTTNKPVANVTYFAQWADIVWTDYLTDCSAPDTWFLFIDGETEKSGEMVEFTKTVELEGNRNYGFKLYKNVEGDVTRPVWYTDGDGTQNPGTITVDNCTGWNFKNTTPGSGNTGIRTTATGNYTFSFEIVDGYPRVSVTYPTAYQVSYEANGGTGTMNPSEYCAAGGTITLAANAYTKADNHFKGWVANVDVKIGGETKIAGTLIADGATIQDINSNITLTAQWETAVTAIVISNVGDIHELTVGSTLQLDMTLTPASPEYGGPYTWYTSNGATMTVDQNGLVTGVQANTNEYIYVVSASGIESNHYIINVKSAECTGWGLHYWNNEHSSDGDLCFVPVAGGAADEYRTEGLFSLPSNSDSEWIKVLYNGMPQEWSREWHPRWVPMIGLQGAGCGGSDGAQYAGQDAIGYFRINTGYEEDNYHLAFQPVYAMTFGVDKQAGWVSVDFAHTTDAEYGTDIVEIPSNFSSLSVYVGTKRADVNPGVNFIKDRSNTVLMNTVPNMTSGDFAGKFGKFYIHDNYCNASNFDLHFTQYYRLHYDLDGGETAAAYDDQFAWSLADAADRTFTLETAPTKDGYTFRGWSVNSTTMQPGASVTLSDDVTATAIWAQNYTVTYDLAGYSTSCSSSTVHYCGEEVTVCPAPEDKTGYTFKGWNTDDITGSPADYTPGETFVMPCERVVDVVFTAHYEADEYTITYEGLEGATHSNPETYTIETPTITLQDPGARTGYNFSHWTCNDATITTIPQGSTGDMTIVAIWNAKQTNITLNHEGSATGSNNVVATYDAAMPAITIPSMAGYTFNGYFDAAKNGTQYYDGAGASVRNWDKEEATADLYAQWTALEVHYTVNHYKQQLDGTYSSTPDKTEDLTALAGATRTPARSEWVGFTAPAGQQVTIAGDGSTVVNYQYTRNKYTLNWVLDGGTPDGDYTEGGDVYYEAPITYPTTVNRDGYCFMGWTYSTGKTTQPTTMPHEALTITAQWAAYTNYRTYCGNAVTFKAQNGTEPEEEFVITTDNNKITTPTLVETGFTQPEGWVLLGWTKVGDDTHTIVELGKTNVAVEDGDVYNAVWTHIAITGNVLTTSAVGVQVGTTIHVEGTTNNAYGLRVSFVDTKGTDDPSDDVTYQGSTGETSVAKSDFRLANTSYTYIDGNIIQIGGAAAGDTHNQDYNVVYTPKTANEIDNYVLQIQVMKTSATALDGALYTLNLKGRALPDNFVIAEYLNDKWYALPADMDGSNTYAGKEIMVEGEGMNRVVTNATLDMVYSMKTYNFDRSHVLFQSQFNQGHLWAATGTETGINDNAKTISGQKDPYSWMPTPQDEALDTYVMSNVNNTKTLVLNSDLKFGMYTKYSTNTETVYFIPLKAEEYVEKEMMMVEWFPTKVLVEVDEDALTGARAKINNVEVADVAASDTKYGTHLYEITGLNTLVDNAANKLTILYTKEETTYGHEFDIPVIVSNKTYILSSTATETKFPWTQAVYNTADLVVRDNSVLTVDGATDAANTFGNVTIYPTSKVVVPAQASEKDVTMTTTTMTLFGGTDEIYDGNEYTLTKYGVPQLVLNGKLVHNETTSGLVYDVRLDAAQYYNFALPYTSKYELVTDNKGGEDFTFWTKVYDGETRAAGNNGWVWYNWDADPWAINIGTGYMFAAQPYSGQNYIIIRHPMGYSTTGDKYAQNEGGHQSGTAEATKAAVDVYAHPSKYDNNAGWNYIANPFMANFTKDLDGEATGTIQTGRLVEHKVNDKWDGHYEWEAGSLSVRYVTLYDNGSDTYTQLPMSTAVLAPFTGFFVQIAEDGQIVFDINGRADEAPARMLGEDELPNEMEIFLHATCQGQKEDAVLYINDNLHRDNAKEFPNEMTKQENANTLNFYTFGGDDIKMYANGMSYEDAQGWSKAGVKVATAGEYTFSVASDQADYIQQVILRDMDSNTEYDLMSNDAKIYLDKGEMLDRFYVKIVFGKHNIGTSVTERYDTSGPEKFILNDHMYIRANGVLFDGVGKRVKY